MSMPTLPRPTLRLSASSWLKKPAITIAILAGLLIWLNLFVVEPTEIAGVRRFGEVTTREPYGPGIHLRSSLIDQVDRLRVSLAGESPIMTWVVWRGPIWVMWPPT